MRETPRRTVTISHQRFELSRDRVERSMQRVLPEPVARHFAVVNGRAFPPKQVIAQVTGLDRADFTTHQARRILMRLGFAAGRRGPGVTSTSDTVGERQHAAAEALRPFIGQWVALRRDDVLVAASRPDEVVAWLARHDLRADTMFRVPEDEVAASGLAPL